LLKPERMLFVGRSPMRRVLARKIAAHPEYQLEAIGEVIDPGEQDLEGGERPVPGELELPNDDAALRTLGTLDELPAIIERTGAERILITQDAPNVIDLLRQCRALQIKVSILPKPFEAMGSGVEVDDLEGVTVLGVNPMVLSRSSRILKRALDLVVALPALIVTAPLMLGVAVAIKLDSKGPVLFRQDRVGRRGREFRLLKFRTMQADAESRREALMAESRDPDWLLLDRDPRISRIGRFLRRVSLDELPQLINVVRGEMSMVGPRPLMEDDDRRVHGWARSRLDLTPGLTGLWQVLGRTSIPFEEMVKLDYLYVSNWSLWEDIRLILRTFSVVVSQRGAN
jgi:exopolysaccharide biosynthesis polyprenyl glycosylphosphotransferase